MRPNNRNNNNVKRRNRAPRNMPRAGRGNAIPNDVFFSRGLPSSAYPTVSRMEERVALHYQDFSSTRLTSSSSFSSFLMRVNGIFDPDPLLLTGGVSGFGEWGGLYRQYLVEAVTVTWNVSNLQNFPIILVMAPSLTALGGVLGSGAAIANLAENKFAQKKKILSGSGGQDRTFFRSYLNLAKFTGQPLQFNSGGYSGFLGTAPSNPVNLIYFNFCAYGPSPLTSGIISDLSIRFHTKLYNVQTPLG